MPQTALGECEELVSFKFHLHSLVVYHAESEIVMVDGCFMVDGPCVNHAEKAVNHVLWLTGLLGRWLTEPCLISNFELSGHQFGTIFEFSGHQFGPARSMDS